jgi:hypothetical protein
MTNLHPARKLLWAKSLWASAILIAGAILAATPSTSNAQGFGGWGHRGWGVNYPSWGYAVGMPGYYADFRAQSYYAAPWIAGYEAPWYGPSLYGPGAAGCGYGFGGGMGWGNFGMGRYPWIWNRQPSFVTRGFVEPRPVASAKVYKNPFYKAEGSSPSDEPKTAASETEPKSQGLIRVVGNPYVAVK